MAQTAAAAPKRAPATSTATIKVLRFNSESDAEPTYRSYQVEVEPTDRVLDALNMIKWYQDGSPATSIRTQRDRILLESGTSQSNRKKYDLGPIVKNQWQTFVLHFIHSYNSDGLIEIWINGTKKITVTGGNMYNNVLPKWKIGLYKSAFKYGTSDVTRRVIYFDNIRVGGETSTYQSMMPTL